MRSDEKDDITWNNTNIFQFNVLSLDCIYMYDITACIALQIRLSVIVIAIVSVYMCVIVCIYVYVCVYMYVYTCA